MLIFANFLLVLGREREVWDSKGQVKYGINMKKNTLSETQVAYYNDDERSTTLEFRVAHERGPRMCMGEKIPGMRTRKLIISYDPYL